MKMKLLSAVLLLVSFGALGILSGAVPVMAEDTEPSAETVVTVTPTSEAEPIPTAPPSPSPESIETLMTAEIPETAQLPEGTTPPVTWSPEPVITPEPVAEIVALAAADLWEPEAEVISTTITASSPLDNDTAYDVDVAALWSPELNVTLSPDGYQVLIIHTHATEAYTPDGDDRYEATDDYRTTDTAHSVVRVGQALADALEAYGINVLHDTALYDYPGYNGSYARSGAAIEEYLAAYPGISIVIDLHRDALGDADTIYKTITSAAGETAAQIMFVMGSDVNLYHPNWRENLQLAMGMQALVEARYEHLTRPTILCDYRYNQQLTTGSLLMEVGTAGNTLQEAITAVELFADVIGPVLADRIAV